MVVQDLLAVLIPFDLEDRLVACLLHAHVKATNACE